MTDAVLFDLDDTLYPYRTYKLSGFHAVAEYVDAECGVPESAFFQTLRSITEEHGFNYSHAFDDAIERHAEDTLSTSELIEVYRSHDPTIQLPAESARVLAAAAEMTSATGIVTEGDSVMQWNKISTLGVSKFVDDIAVTSDKTTTNAFRRFLSKYDISPSDAMYVGDNPNKDFVVPNELGMTTVRIVTGVHAEEPSRSPPPTYEVEDLTQLTEYVRDE